MFRCTGNCLSCGRCGDAASGNSDAERKIVKFSYPGYFRPDRGGSGFGIAFDIGTTTAAAMLWDLRDAKHIDSAAMTNPQAEFGADVISRIAFASSDVDNGAVLRERAVGCCNEMIRELCGRHGLDSGDITFAVVCGNTAMSHFFTGHDTKTLVRPPFEPAYEGPVALTAQESGLEINGKASVLVLPNIAGHVGGDITAGIIASGRMDSPGLTLFADIGTNGEVALMQAGEGMVCSTAAGPAFEGASISQGMRAAPGAVEKVFVQDGELFFRTVGGGVPRGICGSGLMDAAAVMLEEGLMREDGRILSGEEAAAGGAAEGLAERLVSEGNQRKFILVSKTNGEDISITQKDVREMQLAKGALAAGIMLLLGKAGRSPADLDEIIVGGAFGNHLDRRSLVRLGIFPDIEEEKFVFAGNTAGAGASMALLSAEERERAAAVPGRFRHVEPAEEKEFQMLFLNAMSFREMS